MQTNGSDNPYWYIPLIVGFIPIFGAVLLWFIGQWAKRRDDKRRAKLNRLNKQLSDLYGPLFALYETGERNWTKFVEKFSNDPMPIAKYKDLFPGRRNFRAPDKEQLQEYRLCMETIFMPTNIATETVIVNYADLFVGETIPDPLLDLCVHIASNKPLMKRWERQDFDNSYWGSNVEAHKSGVSHPELAARNYIDASFHVLKKEQESFINDPKRDINEASLKDAIERRIKELEDNQENEISRETSTNGGAEKHALGS